MSVVVGYIPNEIGRAALHAAREQAASRGLPLVIVNILGTGGDQDPRHASADDLEAVAEALHRSAVRVEIRQEQAEDDIADTLLAILEREHAELLVIGNRREPSQGRQLLGLTLQRLLLDADCEVLVV